MKPTYGCHFFANLVFATALAAQGVDWPANGPDLQGTRYLPAAAITRDNVGRLAVAWTYGTGETGPRFSSEQETEPRSFTRATTTPPIYGGVFSRHRLL
jgi:glucose dehydrogenase